MATENNRVPPSTEVSPRETEVGSQLPSNAQDVAFPERRRGDRRRAEADTPSGTVRLSIGHLLGGRYRIERELGEGVWGGGPIVNKPP